MTTRRTFVSMGAATAGALASGLPKGLLAAGPARKQSMTPKEVLGALLAGNARFLEGRSVHANHVSRRDTLSAGQSPYAIVLSCSDSRVSPEIIFDQGLGDVFSIRVAGNYAATGGIGSIQYAVEHFKSPLLVVLGHSSCGAVKATVDNVKAGNPPVPGDIAAIVHAITPAVKAVMHESGDVYANAIRENVRRNVDALRSTDPIVAPAVKAGRLEIVGGVYDLKTGRVSRI